MSFSPESSPSTSPPNHHVTPSPNDFEQSHNLPSVIEGHGDTLTQLITDRWTHSTQAIQDLIQNSHEGWDFYLKNQRRAEDQWDAPPTVQDVPQGQRPFHSLRFGMIPRAVDSVRAFLHNAIFPADEKFFRATAKTPFSQTHRDLYEAYRAENFAEDNTTEELRQFLLSLCIDDAACLSVHWKQIIQPKVTYSPKVAPSPLALPWGNTTLHLPISFPLFSSPQSPSDFEEHWDPHAVAWEGTHVECLDFNDWRVNPQARSLEDSWFIRRWYAPVEEIQAMFNLPEAPPPYSPQDATIDSGLSAMGIEDLRKNNTPWPISPGLEPEGERQGLLMVCYDDFILGGKRYPNHMAVILNGKDCVWFGKNPYHHGRKPYIVTSLLPLPGQIYGMSLIRHAIPSAAIIDTIVDKILKIGAFAADPIFEVPASEPALRGDILIEPGMKIPVKQPNAIRQVPIHINNLNLLLDLMNKAETNIREITGASPLFTGEDFARTPQNVTAFQVDQHVQGIQSRFQSILHHFNNAVLEPLLTMAFENDKQFKTQPSYMAGVGDLTLDILKQLDFKWVVTSTQANISRARELENIKSLLLDIAPEMKKAGVLQYSQEGIELNIPAAFKQLMMKAGIHDIEHFISPVQLTSPGADTVNEKQTPDPSHHVPPPATAIKKPVLPPPDMPQT